MLFTSNVFWIFFALVFLTLRSNALTIRSVNLQNTILLMASYIFYMAWDWRFLSLIVASSLIDYFAARRIGQVASQRVRRSWLIVSIVANLSMLGFFKYFNFFASELQALLTVLGVSVSWPTLYIILPVGISFFTFQTMTYTIDVYLGKMKWERNLLKYMTYVAFFPQLVAGPIERARNLLPQFNTIAPVSWAGIYQGISLIIFGLFLKVVIADSLGPLADRIFNSTETFNGGELLLGALYFAGQIYGDFCGYSTIAIGVASIMGFHLMTNFQTPYFSTSIRDFWRNWHISLSTFFRDYIYIPLGGSRGTIVQTERNLLFTFVLSGFWHGANWTFIIWGAIHGLALIVALRFSRWLDWLHAWASAFVGWALTMGVVLACWIIFRSPDIAFSMDYLGRIVMDFRIPQKMRSGIVYVMLVPLVDLLWWRDVRLERGMGFNLQQKMLTGFAEAAILAGMAFTIVAFLVWNGGNNAFIYFQF